MTNDIWAGVDFGDSILNPGSVAETYTPSTGKTTYGTNPAINAVAANSAKYAAAGVVAPSVATPASTPAGAPVYQGAGLGFLGSSSNTNFGEVPGSNGVGINSNYANNPSAFKSELMKPIEYKPEVSASEITQPKISNDEVNNWINQDKATRSSLATEVMQAKPQDFANADYINKVAQAALGRPASKDELSNVSVNKYGLLGATNKDVLARFGLTSNRIGSTGLPVNSTIVDKDGTLVDTDGDGVPDVQQSTTWNKQFSDLSTEIAKLAVPSQQEQDLQNTITQLKGSANLGIANIGDQLGEAMPLIQGEQASLQNQANIKLQTTSDLLTNLQNARNANLNAKQLIYTQMKDKSENAQKNLALILDGFKAGGVSSATMTPQQKLQLQALSNAAGLDSGIVMSSIDAMYQGKLLDTIKNNTMSGVQQQQMIGQIATNLMASGYTSAEAIKQATQLVSGISGAGVNTATPGTPTSSNGSGNAKVSSEVNNVSGIKDVNGNFVQYSTAQESLNATAQDIANKQAGKTKTGLNGNSTLNDFVNTWVTGNAKTKATGYDASNVANYLNANGYKGITANSKFGSVKADDLAKAVASFETGYDGSNFGNFGGGTKIPTTPTPNTPGADLTKKYSADIINGAKQVANGTPLNVAFPDIKKKQTAVNYMNEAGIPIPAQLNSTAMNNLNDAKSAFAKATSLVDTLAGNAQKVFTGGALKNLWNSAMRYNVLDNNVNSAKMYYDTKDSFMSLISRSLGEKGVLTDNDINRVSNALPSAFDNKATADEKIKQLKNVLNEIQASALKTYQTKLASDPNNIDPQGLSNFETN